MTIDYEATNVDPVDAATDRLCERITKKYQNTPASARECLAELEYKLLDIGKEPNYVHLWQRLFGLQQEEERWDSLSAEQQATKKNTPKGKKRKPLTVQG